MPRLGRCCRNRAAPWNALVRREIGPALDVVGQQIEGALRVRLDQLELPEGVLVSLDVIAVLYLVKAINRTMTQVIAILSILVGKSSGDGALIGAGVEIDRPKCVHRSGDGDQRLADLAGRRNGRDSGADIRYRQAIGVAVGSGARPVGIVGRIQPL